MKERSGEREGRDRSHRRVYDPPFRNHNRETILPPFGGGTNHEECKIFYLTGWWMRATDGSTLCMSCTVKSFMRGRDDFLARFRNGDGNRTIDSGARRHGELFHRW